jgi:Uma2 family endonuclease
MTSITMATQPKRLFTLEEYLDQERAAEHRSEFHAGAIYAMAGGTETHARLAAQIAFLLRLKLQDSCRVYGGDLNVYLEKQDQCVYADAMVVCGEPQFWGKRKDVIVNPTLVVEVLSPSTELYDKSDKATYYRGLPSLQHCLLVAQDKIFIEHSARLASGSWMVTQQEDRGSVVVLSALGIWLTAEEIYRSILI